MESVGACLIDYYCSLNPTNWFGIILGIRVNVALLLTIESFFINVLTLLYLAWNAGSENRILLLLSEYNKILIYSV